MNFMQLDVELLAIKQNPFGYAVPTNVFFFSCDATVFHVVILCGAGRPLRLLKDDFTINGCSDFNLSCSCLFIYSCFLQSIHENVIDIRI